MKIGQEIKQRRTLLNLSQDQLAAALKCPTRNISAWENGQNDPRWTDLINLSSVLGAFSTTDNATLEADAQKRARLEVQKKVDAQLNEMRREVLKERQTALDLQQKSLELQKQVDTLRAEAGIATDRHTRFNRILRAYGYKQKAIAEALEIPVENLSRYANEKRPWPHDVKTQLVQWFGELLFDEDSK